MVEQATTDYQSAVLQYEFPVNMAFCSRDGAMGLHRVYFGDAPMTIGRKTGGRKPGSKNRITDAMRRDILAVYKQLGGRKWLAQWAAQNETEFVGKVLARVLPPMAKEADPEPDGSCPPSANMSDIEIARRIVFALSKAAYAVQPADGLIQPAIEAEPVPLLPSLDAVRVEPE